MQKQSTASKVNIPINRLAFYVGMGIIFLLVTARNLLKINVPVELILITSVIIATFGKKTEIIALVISFIPLSSAFQYKYAIIACVVIYLLKYYKDFKFSWAIIPFILLLLWELLHGIGYQFSISNYLRNFTELIFCTILLLVSVKDVEYKFIVRSLAVTALFVSFIIFLNLMVKTGFNLAEALQGEHRFGASDVSVTSYGLNFNANQFGFICNLAIVGLLQLVITKQNLKIDYVFIVFLVLFGIMTMSRAFLLGLVLILLLFIFARKEPITSKIKKIFIAVLAFVLLFLLALWIMPSVIEKFYERFTVDDITNGRDYLWGFYNTHISSSAEYAIYGVGLQSIPEKMLLIHGIEILVPHNGIQEIVVAWGFVGLLMFIVYIIACLRVGNQSNKQSLTSYMVFILALVQSMSGHIITSGTMMLSICLGVLSLCLVKKQ